MTWISGAARGMIEAHVFICTESAVSLAVSPPIPPFAPYSPDHAFLRGINLQTVVKRYASECALCLLFFSLATIPWQGAQFPWCPSRSNSSAGTFLPPLPPQTQCYVVHVLFRCADAHVHTCKTPTKCRPPQKGCDFAQENRRAPNSTSTACGLREYRTLSICLSLFPSDES